MVLLVEMFWNVMNKNFDLNWFNKERSYFKWEEVYSWVFNFGYNDFLILNIFFS